MTSSFESDIAEMLATFRKGTAHLFEPSNPDHFEVYQKGTYGNFFAKPSPAVRETLVVDREILVLATSFNDLQARTVKLIIDIMDDQSVRLERTVAIVIHRDPHGDAKLKNWGKEQGIVIIPFYMKGDALPSKDDFERRMLAPFYSRDPFDVSGPVSADTQFYGRRDEAQDLARQLQQGQVRSCLGIRKIGKTSLLHRVLAILQDHHDCYTVMVDCSKDSIWRMDAAQLLGAIAEAVPRALASEECGAEVRSSSFGDVVEAYDALATALRSANATVVLVMDETDYITPGSSTAPHWQSEFVPFWRNLRALHQELARSHSRLSVLVGGVSSKWFAQESIDGIENAALAFLPEEYLAPMTTRASIEMVKSLGRMSGLVIDDDAATWVALSCSNLPFWVRKAGSYMHRHVPVETRPESVGLAQAKMFVEAFVRSEGAPIAEVALSHLFRVYPELREPAMACAAGDASAHSTVLRNTLCKYGIIKTPSAYPELSGEMMAAGLGLALARPTSDALATPVRDDTLLAFSSLDEWAEEIAVGGAKRNVLEKRMRSIALEFIRFDVLKNKQRGTLRDRVVRVLEPKRHSQLQHLAPDQVIEKYMWLDLMNLMVKEWDLFEPLYGDKSSFKQQCLTVNERPDAHAKGADRADIALYRKALAWLEDAVARAS
jgi:hypothetical protein